MRLAAIALAALLFSCGPARPVEDLTPPDPPTQQDYAAVPGGLSLSWHNPKDKDFAATMLARYEGTTYLAARPLTGGIYKVGDPIGNAGELGSGVIVSLGKTEGFSDLTLSDACRAVTYQLWSRDHSDNWSVGPAQLDVPRGARSKVPSSAPTALSAAAVDNDVQLAWTNPPASSGWTELRVVRKSGTAPTSPIDGVAVFTGNASSAAEPLAGMPNGTWLYGVFACNGCGVCNPAPAVVSFSRTAPVADAGEEDAGTTDGGAGGGGGDDGGMAPLTPLNFVQQLSGDGKNVLLSWGVPPGVTQVKLLRSLNAAPIGPGDTNTTLVFQGLASNAAERVDKLLPSTAANPRAWHYRVYGCRNASCETMGAGSSLSLTVAQALRGGGYNIFWRHATANVCGDQTQLGPASNTTVPNWWKSCDKNCATAYARQIDMVQAPNETATVHTAFATRGFTVGRVLSSEFCRAVETAQGFDFGPAIEHSQVLSYFVYDEGQRCTNTLQLLNTAPAAGTNTALVSHAGFTCAIIDALAWGEGAIYRPTTGASPLFIGRVAWNGWTALP